MAASVKNLLTVLVIWQSVIVSSGFEFDHAFRKISMENSAELSNMDTLMKRIGLAMGEEEEVEEPLEEHKLLRRVGLGPEDQDAVESMLNTEGLRQFSSGSKRTRKPMVAKMDLSYKGDLYKEGLSKMGLSYKGGDVSTRRQETSHEEEQDKEDEDVFMRRRNQKPVTRRQESSLPELKIKDWMKDGIDLSKIPMEHRDISSNSVYSKMAGSARTLVVAATNNALQSSTIATYLTQMWIGNILQTIGWSIVGAFVGANSGRRSFGSTGRHGEDDLHDDEDDEEDGASGLENMDHRMVASILRGLADAADNWEHTEL